MFPIYAFLVAYNLARPGVDLPRIIVRLALVATITQPFHVLAFPYGVLPLNVLYTFAAAAGIMHLVEKRQAVAAIVVWLVAGVLVDYAFMGVGLTLACWFYFRQPRLARAGVVWNRRWLVSASLRKSSSPVSLTRCGLTWVTLPTGAPFASSSEA